MGRPTDEDTYYGPITEKTYVMNFTDKLKLLLGGKIGFRRESSDNQGAYYPAAIF
jgi:hypothetical protein